MRSQRVTCQYHIVKESIRAGPESHSQLLVHCALSHATLAFSATLRIHYKYIKCNFLAQHL